MTGANIISAIQNLKMAQEQFEDFCRQYPNSQGSRLFKKYSDKTFLLIHFSSRYKIDEIKEYQIIYETKYENIKFFV